MKIIIFYIHFVDCIQVVIVYLYLQNVFCMSVRVDHNVTVS